MIMVEGAGGGVLESSTLVLFSDGEERPADGKDQS
jgi:hypothetical protein